MKYVFLEPTFLFHTHYTRSSRGNLKSLWFLECQQHETVHGCARVHQLPESRYDGDRKDMSQQNNNYKSNDRKFQRLEPCMQEHLFSHFSMAGHNGFLIDVSITFIDKTDPSDPLRREDYWRETLKTMVPYGLNIEDSV